MLTIYFINLAFESSSNTNKVVSFCQKQFHLLNMKYMSKYIKFKEIFLQKDKYAYSIFLKSIWGQTDIILIEHDMFIKKIDLEQMIKCKYKLICSAQYKVSKFIIVDKIKYFSSANRNIIAPFLIMDKGHTQKKVINLSTKNETHLYDYGSFGFCKISLLVQKHIKIPTNDWRDLDSKFYEQFIAYYGSEKIHSHKYITHLHIY